MTAPEPLSPSPEIRAEGENASEQFNAGIEAQREAFVKGAKWWEWHETGATMWPSDQRLAYEQAVKKYPDTPLGDSAPEIRYQLRNWHHVNCAVSGGACNCLEQREALIAELYSLFGERKQ